MMQARTRYLVLEEKTAQQLQGAVQDFLDAGYETIGGVSCVHKPFGVLKYMQAVVKRP